MARRLILDTSILIGAERSGAESAAGIRPDDDVAIAAISIAELRIGVELASAEYRAGREQFVGRVIASVPVEPYDLGTTSAHAALLAYVRRSGQPRGAHDLIIAATAIATNRAILTTDARARFDDLPGVTTARIS